MTTPFLRDVQIQAPDGWSDFSTISLVGPETGSFRANAMVSADESDLEIGAYLENQLEELKREQPNAKIVREDAATLSGRPARLVEISFKGEGGIKLRQRQLVTKVGRRVITLSLTDTEDGFAKSSGVLDTIAASFRLP